MARVAQARHRRTTNALFAGAANVAIFGSGVIVFCMSQAFRDVYFAHVFQGIDFFLVICGIFHLLGDLN